MATSGIIASVSRDDEQNPRQYINQNRASTERPGGVSRFFSSFCSCFQSASAQPVAKQSTIRDEPFRQGGAWRSGQDLLPVKQPAHQRMHTLVLDLDETLVHSSFKPVADVDFVVPVEIDGMYHNVYVLKRPGVDEFMRRVGQIFEVVVFTASLGKYANPVLDLLDIHKSVHLRLFREGCVNYEGISSRISLSLVVKSRARSSLTTRRRLTCCNPKMQFQSDLGLMTRLTESSRCFSLIWRDSLKLMMSFLT